MVLFLSLISVSILAAEDKGSDNNCGNVVLLPFIHPNQVATPEESFASRPTNHLPPMAVNSVFHEEINPLIEGIFDVNNEPHVTMDQLEFAVTLDYFSDTDAHFVASNFPKDTSWSSFKAAETLRTMLNERDLDSQSLIGFEAFGTVSLYLQMLLRIEEIKRPSQVLELLQSGLALVDHSSLPSEKNSLIKGTLKILVYEVFVEVVEELLGSNHHSLRHLDFLNFIKNYFSSRDPVIDIIDQWLAGSTTYIIPLEITQNDFELILDLLENGQNRPTNMYSGKDTLLKSIFAKFDKTHPLLSESRNFVSSHVRAIFGALALLNPSQVTHREKFQDSYKKIVRIVNNWKQTNEVARAAAPEILDVIRQIVTQKLEGLE